MAEIIRSLARRIPYYPTRNNIRVSLRRNIIIIERRAIVFRFSAFEFFFPIIRAFGRNERTPRPEYGSSTGRRHGPSLACARNVSFRAAQRWPRSNVKLRPSAFRENPFTFPVYDEYERRIRRRLNIPENRARFVPIQRHTHRIVLGVSNRARSTTIRITYDGRAPSSDKTSCTYIL